MIAAAASDWLRRGKLTTVVPVEVQLERARPAEGRVVGVTVG